MYLDDEDEELILHLLIRIENETSEALGEFEYQTVQRETNNLLLNDVVDRLNEARSNIDDLLDDLETWDEDDELEYEMGKE